MAYDSTDFVVEVDETTRILKEARNLVSNGWCKGYFARDGNDQWTSIMCDDATSFCSIGALARVVGTIMLCDERVLNAYARLQQQIDRHNVASYNDSHTHEEVLDMFDRAIVQGTK